MSRLLVFAPHADDEVLGCGGTILKNIDAGNDVFVCVVTKGCPPLFSEERVAIVRQESMSCHQKMGVKKTFYLDFPAVMLENTERFRLNQAILQVVQDVMPDEVYIPHYGDMQKDHQLVAEACMVALRPKYQQRTCRILSYETLSETGWNTPVPQNEFIPTVYEDIHPYLDKKMEAMACYRSQLSDFPQARSLESIRVLAKYRGTLMGLEAAEAFMLIRELR